MSQQNNYKRAHSKVAGAERAAAPRSHAEMPASPKAKKANPQRRDIIVRTMLSSRKEEP
jgi:hypothetical protein